MQKQAAPLNMFGTPDNFMGASAGVAKKVGDALGRFNWNPLGLSNSADTQAYMSDAQNLPALNTARQNQENGAAMLNALMLGGGAGAGATALFHLARGLKMPGKKEKKYRNMASGAPQIVGEKTSNDQPSAAAALMQALGSVPDQLSQKIHSATGGILGAGGGAGPVGGALTTTMQLGLGGAGLVGGKKLVDAIMARKQKADAASDVDDARQYYQSVLSGTHKQAAALDEAFARFEEKQANDAANGVLGAVGGAINGVGHVVSDTIPRYATTMALLSALAGAGVGGTFMYDRTAEKTRGTNLAKAQASRARMSALPNVWVDPEELARVKQLAAQHA